MLHSFKTFLVSTLLCAVFMINPSLADPGSHGGWDTSSYLWSTGEITDVAVYADELYAAGVVPQELGKRPLAIGRWDGQSWQPIPNAPTGQVHVLLPFRNTLVVAGKLTNATGHRPLCATAWTGSEWRPMRAGLKGVISCLVEYRGELIAGGEFKSSGRRGPSHLARWDGNRWQPLGSPLTGGGVTAVHTMTVHNDILYVGGVFVKAGDLTVHNIAAWDGNNWSSLGVGANDPVLALTLYGGQIIAGGRFTKMDNAPHPGLARWDGNRWLGLADGLPMAERVGKKFEVRALKTFSGNLVVGGYFPSDNEFLWGLLSIWNGDRWLSVVPPLDFSYSSKNRSRVSCFAEFDGGFVVGGSMGSADGKEIGPIAIWKNNAWTSLGCGNGLRSQVHALYSFQGMPLALHKDHRSDLVLSHWDGSTWQSLNRRTKTGGRVLSSVYGVASRGDELIIFGKFKDSSKKSLRAYARYDDGWEPLGKHWFDHQYSAHQMIFHGSNLVASESSSRVKPKSRLRSWDGSNWTTIPDSEFNRVDALQSDGRQIYLASHDPASHPHHRRIMSWDGTSWSNILKFPTRRGNVVLAMHEKMLHVGISYLAPEDSLLSSVMRWDGQAWMPVGGRLQGPRMEKGTAQTGNVKDLTTFQGQLIATGSFRRVGDIPSPGLAWFDGTRWRPWEGNMWRGEALLAQADSLLVGGGSFNGKSSKGINRWVGPIPQQVQVSEQLARRNALPKKPSPDTASPTISTRAVRSMDQLLTAFEESYPRMDRLGKAWPMLAGNFRRKAEAVESEKDYEQLVKIFLNRLQDRTIIFQASRRPSSEPPTSVSNKLRNYERQRGWVDDNICYLLLNQPRFYAKARTWLADPHSADGMILDLRTKSGGGHYSRQDKREEFLGLVGLLTDFDLPYGTIGQRAGKSGTALTEPDTLRVKPLSRRVERLPLVCLIDSSVSGQLVELALVLKALPNTRLVGTGTGTLLGSARMVNMELGGGVWIPLTRTFTLDGRELTDQHGVQPDIFIDEGRYRNTIFDVGVETLRTMMKDGQK